MGNRAAAHQSYWRTADAVFGIPLLAALLLQWLVPLSIPWPELRPARIIAGALCMAAGIVLIVQARRALSRRGQPADPGQPTSAVVTTGVFAISRNPLYLGAAGFLVGLGLAADWPWVLALLIPSLAACRYLLIGPEERYLSARFGAEYHEYVATVRRWIGRTRPRR